MSDLIHDLRQQMADRRLDLESFRLLAGDTLEEACSACCQTKAGGNGSCPPPKSQ